MQQFPCPFCGLRNEQEFHFVGEAGKTRPDTASKVSPPDWADYLYTQKNAMGEVREVWMHSPCAEIFIMRRDSVSMAVLGVEQLRKDRP